MMKIEAKTIDELIEKSGQYADSLSKLEELIVETAPELVRRFVRLKVLCEKGA